MGSPGAGLGLGVFQRVSALGVYGCRAVQGTSGLKGPEHSQGGLEQKSLDSKGLYKEHSTKGVVQGHQPAPPCSQIGTSHSHSSPLQHLGLCLF